MSPNVPRRSVAVTAAAPSRASLAAAAFLVVAAVAPAAHADPILLWQHYPGSVEMDYGEAVAIDTQGNVLVGGQTFGSIGRRDNHGADAFVIKYSPEGQIVWRRQPGPARYERLHGLATDSADNVIAVGETNGAVGGPIRGTDDGFVVKYAADGTVQWKRQFSSTGLDFAYAVTADPAGNVIVAGQVDFNSFCCTTGDAFVIKYGPDGTEKWRRSFHLTGSDVATAIATSTAGDIFAAGYTANANSGVEDTFIARLSADGALRWIKQQTMSGDQRASSITVDGTGRLFVGGTQSGPSGSFSLGWVAAFAGDGTALWRRTFGGDRVYDDAHSVAIDATGHVLVSGSESGEAIVSSYSRDGALRWRISPQRFDRSRYTFLAADGTGHMALVSTANVSRAAGYWNANVARYEVD